jgi:predicted phosphodiesterase
VKIVCVSDTHTYGKQIDVPEGDVLIHAGDHTFRGTESETKAAVKWLDRLPHKHKIIIAGNHDFFFDERFQNGHIFRNWEIRRSQTVAEFMAHYPSVTYLQDSAVTIDGVKFYGTPWQPRFHEWAFNFPLVGAKMLYSNSVPPHMHDREAAAAKWAEIPDDVNVLITHGPPAGILDTVWGVSGDNRAGCPELRKRIEGLHSLRLHVFGHLHEAYGKETFRAADGSEIVFVNAAINTRDYDPTNAPIIVELAA